MRSKVNNAWTRNLADSGIDLINTEFKRNDEKKSPPGGFLPLNALNVPGGFLPPTNSSIVPIPNSHRASGIHAGNQMDDEEMSPLALNLMEFIKHATFRFGRTTSFSHFICFLLLTTGLLVTSFATIVYNCLRNCCCKIKTKTTTNYYSPWTSEYHQPIDPYVSYAGRLNDAALLTEEDYELGWVVERSLASASVVVGPITPSSSSTLFVGRKEHLVKKWTRHEVAEDRVKIGQKKRTWEVAAENSIATFRMDDNPRYVDVVTEMRANMRRKDREMQTPVHVQGRVLQEEVDEGMI